jgi:hypothetical protein
MAKYPMTSVREDCITAINSATATNFVDFFLRWAFENERCFDAWHSEDSMDAWTRQRQAASPCQAHNINNLHPTQHHEEEMRDRYQERISKQNDMANCLQDLKSLQEAIVVFRTCSSPNACKALDMQIPDGRSTTGQGYPTIWRHRIPNVRHEQRRICRSQTRLMSGYERQNQTNRR